MRVMRDTTRWTTATMVLLATTASADVGGPLSGLTSDQLATFTEGRTVFEEVEDASDGLGPVFNANSCVACHNLGATGGGGDHVETRFGTMTSGAFDPMTSRGGSLIQTDGIGPQGACTFVGEVVPSDATIVAGRRTTPLFGLGLVDAVPDAVFRGLAAYQARFQPEIAGRPNVVTDVVTGKSAVGKFGWKSQVPNLLQFSADAYLNEMGVTSPLFPTENCPQGDCSLLACDPVADPEDDGTDVGLFHDFMQFLAPPPRGRVGSAEMAGAKLFARIGCASCHLPALVTGGSAVAALTLRAFQPYSDFLLHDMGPLGDGIEQGLARGGEMRTAPLWGLRYAGRLLHDGRAASIPDAILAHDGQGRSARDRFVGLGAAQQAALIAFLRSL